MQSQHELRKHEPARRAAEWTDDIRPAHYDVLVGGGKVGEVWMRASRKWRSQASIRRNPMLGNFRVKKRWMYSEYDSAPSRKLAIEFLCRRLRLVWPGSPSASGTEKEK